MALLRGNKWKRRTGAGSHLLLDGGIGTCLMEQGIAPDSILRANVQFPDLIRQLHRDYFAAGARLLTANTFGLPGGKGWRDGVSAGLMLAQESAIACDREAGVLFSLVPEAILAEPAFITSLLGELTLPPAVLIETGTDLSIMARATEAAKAFHPDWLIATCHFTGEYRLKDGTPAETVARTLKAAGADCVGANCGDDVASLLELSRRFRRAVEIPLIVQPNAGLPHRASDGSLTYPLTTDAFAELARSLWNEGVSIVGGCCGTTPAHITAANRRRPNL